LWTTAGLFCDWHILPVAQSWRRKGRQTDRRLLRQWFGLSSAAASLMEDLLWILVTVGLVAATLAYARLCDNA
jgi:hypothetical protein